MTMVMRELYLQYQHGRPCAGGCPSRPKRDQGLTVPTPGKELGTNTNVLAASRFFTAIPFVYFLRPPR